MSNKRAAALQCLTAKVVRAYFAKNVVPRGHVAELISVTHAALVLATELTVTKPAARCRPAVSIRKSVTDEAITCLEDGLSFRSLKLHLQAHHGMSPQQYRTKWGLPSDYPMVAPGYSAMRSALAKQSGLGMPKDRDRHQSDALPIRHASSRTRRRSTEGRPT